MSLGEGELEDEEKGRDLLKTPAGRWLLRTTLRLKRALSAAAVFGPW